jgi:hypothetical protein
MPEIRSAPRFARNLALAAAAVLLTATVLTIAVLAPGSRARGCPSGEDWIVAAPLGASMAGYDDSTALPRSALPHTAQPRTSAPAGTASSAEGAAGAAAASPLLLVGCVDTNRLHPVPLSTDGRG